MIRHIIRKEFTDVVRDGRFRWCTVLVGSLLLVSLGHGWVQARKVQQEHAAAQATAREHWETQGEKNPHSAAHYGIYAFKPRLALSFIDEGVDPYTGTTVWLEAHRQNDFLLRPAQDATAAQRIGALTAAQVLQHLVPLLIILLTFGALASERERGTLRQLLASGIGRRDLAVGKALGVAGALSLLLVPAALLGAAALVVGSPGPAASPLVRGLTLTGVYLAYFGAFLALSLAVSAWARSGRTALVILLAVWVVNGLVAPRVAVDLSKWLHPTPSAFEFARTVQNEMAAGVGDLSPPDRGALTDRLLAEHGVERVEDLPINLTGVYLQELEEYGNVVFDHNYGALWDTFERQSTVHETLAVAAPLLAVRSLSMGLAGTDVEQHRHFAVAAETYRRDLVRLMNGDMAENSRSGDFSYVADADLWTAVPPLQYAAPTLGWVLGNRILSLLVLGAWLTGAVLFARARVRRVEVG
ncbi:MAG: ABC transporter permease subunit [Gemmatimonadetes bacterium]|nr:ABC transporter permease subunit [Gemmatimonadota bacterium]MYH53451.1 ABC transporter permease subunit [Gemmatimonadota bacterium]MYK65206.1 ABC transporter permease subunit [Gemmatimonadota bacterium]